MSSTIRRPVLTRKQAADLISIVKNVATTAGKYVAARPDTPEKQKSFDAYKDQVDMFEDYIRSLTESGPPPIKPPEAAK